MVVSAAGASSEVLEVHIHRRFRVCEDLVEGGEELAPIDPGGLIAGNIVPQMWVTVVSSVSQDAVHSFH